MRDSFTNFEPLESRRLMAATVSASTLAGPLKAGTTWVYDNPESPAITTTIIVHGAARLGRTKTIRIDAGSKSGHTKISSSSYVNFNSTGYSLLQAASATNVNTNTSVDTYSPFEVLFPSAMRPRTTYRYQWKDTTTNTVSGTKTTSTDSVSFSIKLASTTLTKVHVAAGTFKCYTVYSTTVTNSGTSTDTENDVMYLAPGVGLVKDVTTSGTDSSTVELKAFTAG